VTAGLILAAGESRRMGTPKALLRYRGETFLDGLIARFQARCAPVIVVLGAAEREVRSGARRAATFILNEGWESGQTGSMQCGLRAVPAAAGGVLFTLVDHPAVKIATIDALLGSSEPGQPKPDPPPAADAGRGGLLRVPRYRGLNGHPIWFSSALIGEFLGLGESGAARDIVRAHARETEFIEVDDPGVVADIDDAAAYHALLEAER